MPATTTPPSFDPSFILWIFFAFALAVTAYFVFALLYHWIRYGMLYPLVWIALPIYLTGVVVFISIMLGAIALV